MYYEINEEIARRAWQNVHMDDYRPGSATAEYRAAVDKVAALVEQRKQRISPFYHPRLEALLNIYAQRLAEWTDARNRNSAAYPSWFIAGPANYNMKKHAAQQRREESLWDEYRHIQGLLAQISAVGTGPIDFADPHAREMLTDRVSRLAAELQRAKDLNAYYSRRGTCTDFPGLSAEDAAAIDAAIRNRPWHDKPAPDYELSSLRGKLKRAQERLAEYDKLHAPVTDNAAGTFQNTTPPEPFKTESASGEIVRNIEQNRLQILFDDIPGESLRSALKSHGFRWSPKNSAWQRQLTANAEYAARHILGIA